jgi:hypothetical protein
LHQAGEYSDEGRFAGAVRSQQQQPLATREMEIDLGQRG